MLVHVNMFFLSITIVLHNGQKSGFTGCHLTKLIDIIILALFLRTEAGFVKAGSAGSNQIRD